MKANNDGVNSGEDTKMLRDAAINALKELKRLIQSDGIDVKSKIDMLKWICEMHFGKPGAAKTETKSDGVTVISFDGELEKWSS